MIFGNLSRGHDVHGCKLSNSQFVGQSVLWLSGVVMSGG